MNEEITFSEWTMAIDTIFWANGRFWDANPDFLDFMYQDDATPMEVFELVMSANG